MFHVLTVRMVYKAFSSCKVTSFGSDIYHEKLIFVKSGHEVVLTIRGLRTEEKKLELLRAVLNVLYVYLGAFTILSISCMMIRRLIFQIGY